ncbi:DUF1351 domain-containing protein [Frateuria edaphi]|uniref:DUF1351 domain-containing protein n=1 Tax=Frateuria edaphi TaxID=2898793 RepID=UPI001E56FCE8|nr:DUF1351 domain-containing protein [Frateuria edaphi]UGB46960.1 DUF1351 domain-containing protein [Frateuria edaphi]
MSAADPRPGARRPALGRPALTTFNAPAGSRQRIPMNASTEKNAGSNLTEIAEYTDTAAALADLRQRYQGLVVDVSTPKGLKEAKAMTFELRTLRTTLEKRRKELKAPIIERGKLLDDEAKRITAEIVALEEPIDVQIKAEEARIEEEKLRKLEQERQRVEAIQNRITEIRNLPSTLVGKPSVIIQGKLARLREEVLDEDEFAEHYQTARDALDACIARIEQQLQAQLDHEAEQRRIEAERAELTRMREENERLQREAEERRRADEERERAARAEQERKEREAREAEEQRVATIRQKINTAAQAAEDLDGRSAQFIASRKDRYLVFLHENQTFDFQEFGDEWMRASRASLAGIDTYLAAAQEAERIENERRAEEERRLQAERDRQAAEQKRLDEQAEKLRREKAEAARKAEAERLANIGLREAAEAAVAWFVDEGRDDEQVCTDLKFALSNDTAASIGKPARGKKAANA